MDNQQSEKGAWITFSAHDEADVTVVQAQALLRATDPLSEMGLRQFGHKREDYFCWLRRLHRQRRT